MKKARWLHIAGIFLVFIIMVGFSGCSLATKSYTIHLMLGHMNIDDAGPITIYVTGMVPSEGGVGLKYGDFFPTSGYLDYTVNLSNPKDFTIYVEAPAGNFSAKYEIENGASYSFYYVASGFYNHIEGTKL